VVVGFGVPWEASLITVAGTALQHIVDSVIAIAVVKAAEPLIKTLRGKKKSDTAA